MAVRKVLQSFAPKLAGLCVKWHTDNQNVVGIGWPEVSGWLMQNLLGLFVLASGWLARSRRVAYVNSFGFICYSQWVVSTGSIRIFCSLLYSQWTAYVDFVGIFCYSQWVVCTDPLTLGVLSVGALRSSFCFVLVLLILLVLPVGGLGVASRAFTQFFVVVVVLIFPVLDRSVGQRLPCSEPHPRFVCFLVGSTGI